MWIEIQTPEAPTPGWCANGIFHTDSLYVSAGSKDGEPFAKIGLNSPEVVTLLGGRDIYDPITESMHNGTDTEAIAFGLLLKHIDGKQFMEILKAQFTKGVDSGEFDIIGKFRDLLRIGNY